MKKKVEDILIAENISAESIRHETGAGQEETKLASRIYAYLRAPKNILSVSEKKELKCRIQHSVENVKRKRNGRRWIAAASVLLFAVFSGIWYVQINRSPDIVDFANSIIKNKNDSITRLVLNDGYEVRISEMESKIQYDRQGKKIDIGAKKVQQELEPVKPVYNTVIVPYGKRAQITLSEGSKVWLNSGSKLVYPAVFAANLREVYLDGEAIFEVSGNPERPFIVKSHNFDIEVIGTVFNMSAYSDDKYSNTVLERGAIKLIHKAKAYLPAESQVISPGHMAIFDPEQGKFHVQEVEPSDYLSWRNGYYVFKSEMLGNILKKLSRYYRVEIILEKKSLFYDTFSGSLDLKSNPEEVLNIIKKTSPLKFRKEDKRIIIY